MSRRAWLRADCRRAESLGRLLWRGPERALYCDLCCFFVPVSHEFHVSAEHRKPHYARYLDAAEADKMKQERQGALGDPDG